MVKVKILLVDDDKRIQKTFQDFLPLDRYELVGASNSIEAQMILSSQPVGLAVLDLNLNGESGLTLLKTIRKTNQTIPVIVFSGAVSPEIEIQLKEAQADVIIDKSNGILPVLEKIDALLG